MGDYFETFRPIHKAWGSFLWHEKLASIIAHVSVPVGLLLSPELGGLVGPLLIALTAGELSRSVEEEAIEAFNFSITMAVLMFFSEVVGRLDEHFVWNSSAGVVLSSITVGIAAVSAYRASRNVGEHDRRYPHSLRVVVTNASWVPKDQLPERQKRDWQSIKLNRARFVSPRLSRRSSRSQPIAE